MLFEKTLSWYHFLARFLVSRYCIGAVSSPNGRGTKDHCTWRCIWRFLLFPIPSGWSMMRSGEVPSIMVHHLLVHCHFISLSFQCFIPTTHPNILTANSFVCKSYFLAVFSVISSSLDAGRCDQCRVSQMLSDVESMVWGNNLASAL